VMHPSILLKASFYGCKAFSNKIYTVIKKYNKNIINLI